MRGVESSFGKMVRRYPTRLSEVIVDMIQADFESRRFQLWLYRFAHKLLLIRSPVSPSSTTNVDLACIGLKYISSPFRFGELSIKAPSAEEVDRLSNFLGEELESSMVRILSSAGRRFPVVASRFLLEENNLEFFEYSSNFITESQNIAELNLKLQCSKSAAVATCENVSGSRIFHFWELRVSHGSILIRSPADTFNSNNLDLVIMGVEYLAMPVLFDGLSLEDPTEFEIKEVERVFGRTIEHPSKVVILASAGRRFPVVACHFSLEENHLELSRSRFAIFEP